MAKVKLTADAIILLLKQKTLLFVISVVGLDTDATLVIGGLIAVIYTALVSVIVITST